MIIQIWIYEHYKWKQYEVMGEVFHSETKEIMILYKPLYNSSEFWENALWVRPKNDFFDMVNIDGKKIPRFRFISSL